MTPGGDTPGSTAARTGWMWLNLPFLALIMLYRLLLAPLMSGHCRFVPTCSVYAQEAYLRYNPIRATWMTLRRLARCHPWGGGGFDPPVG